MSKSTCTVHVRRTASTTDFRCESKSPHGFFKEEIEDTANVRSYPARIRAW